MKTIRLFLCSILLVFLTCSFANAAPQNTTQSHTQPAQQVPTSKTVNDTTQVQKAVPAADTPAVPLQPARPPDPQPPAPAPIAAPVVALTNHDELMQAAGISQADWSAVDYIVSHESGWCATKWEGTTACPADPIEVYSWDYVYKGYGMCQSTPAIKMAVSGTDWQTNPVTQLQWCSAYAQARYGGWQAAYSHWLSHHNW